MSFKNLKKINDNTYQEAEPPKDRSRPLEWRRFFKHLSLDLINIQIWDLYKVNETDTFYNFHKDDENRSMATANSSYVPSIRADVDLEKLEDTIRYSVPIDKENGIYDLERNNGKIRIVIKSGDLHSYKKDIIKDVFAGSIFRTNFEPNEDDLCIEVSMPQEDLEKIINTFLKDSKASLKANIDIMSFTYEVDDALREWYHPRDMFIDNGVDIALISSLIVTRGNKVENINNYDENNVPSFQEPAPNLLNNHNIAVIEKRLNGIKRAIYALVLILFLVAIK